MAMRYTLDLTKSNAHNVHDTCVLVYCVVHFMCLLDDLMFHEFSTLRLGESLPRLLIVSIFSPFSLSHTWFHFVSLIQSDSLLSSVWYESPHFDGNSFDEFL